MGAHWPPHRVRYFCITRSDTYPSAVLARIRRLSLCLNPLTIILRPRVSLVLCCSRLVRTAVENGQHYAAPGVVQIHLPRDALPAPRHLVRNHYAWYLPAPSFPTSPRRSDRSRSAPFAYRRRARWGRPKRRWTTEAEAADALRRDRSPPSFLDL